MSEDEGCQCKHIPVETIEWGMCVPGGVIYPLAIDHEQAADYVANGVELQCRTRRSWPDQVSDWAPLIGGGDQ